MDAAQLDRLVREAITAVPDPPRPVPRWVLLEHSVLNGPALAVIAVGAITLWAVSQLAGGDLVGDQDTQLTVFTVVLTALGVGLIGLPLLTYARLAHVLRHGVRTVARVTELDMPDTPPAGDDADTAAPRRHGRTPSRRVTGHRLVEHPAGLYEEPFATDADWADALMPGSEIDVVVHPRRPRVLLDLGLA